MTTHVIAIGGTGARLVEAITHLAAAGIFIGRNGEPGDLHVVFVDPDQGNGNLARTRATTLPIYRRCQERIARTSDLQPISWMRTEVLSADDDLWTPFQHADASMTLRDTFRLQRRSPTHNLASVLYTQEEQDMSLRDGFRGRPAVGVAMMTNFIRDNRINRSWRDFINTIREGDEIFLCASIFGGTGASGFPTLGRLLAREIEDSFNDVKLGGVLMLPYFDFGLMDRNNGIYACPEEFTMRSKVALEYYGNHNPKFDKVYLLGTPNLTSIGDAEVEPGGASQKNPPHFLELYGALALRDFLLTDGTDDPRVIYLSRNSKNRVAWDDIPDSKEVANKLKCMTRFAFAWLSAIVPDLEYARENRENFNDVRWASRFFNEPETLRNDRDSLMAIHDWSRNYLEWLLKVNQPEEVQWFKSNILEPDDHDNFDRDKFPDLVLGRGLDQNGAPMIDTSPYLNQFLDRLFNRKIAVSEDQRVVGLAKSLYRAIGSSL